MSKYRRRFVLGESRADQKESTKNESRAERKVLSRDGKFHRGGPEKGTSTRTLPKFHLVGPLSGGFETVNALRKQRAESVAADLRYVVTLGAFGRGGTDLLTRDLHEHYYASTMQSRHVLKIFGSLYPEEDKYSKTMGPGDWVSFLVRFHPLIDEAEPSPKHGYKISEIHDLTLGSPQWFIFGKTRKAYQAYKSLLRERPQTVIGHESLNEPHTIILGWRWGGSRIEELRELDNIITEMKFVREFTNGDPIKGQALHYKHSGWPGEHFRTIQDAARAVARSEGLVFLPNLGTGKVGAAFPGNQESSFPLSLGSALNDPQNVMKWSVEEVVNWLRRKGFPESVQKAFRDHEIKGDVLFKVTPVMMRVDMGIEDAKQRTRIVEALFELSTEIRLKRSPYMRSLAPLPEAEDLGKGDLGKGERGEKETWAKWI